MSSEKSTGTHAGLSPGRRRIFFVVTLSAPVLFLVILECALRLIHYGGNLDLFVTEVIAGKEYYRMNPDVKSRYFTRVPFSPSTSPDFFQMPKPPGTFRIFCLGGSTTVGYPYWYNGSFSTFLRDRLEATFPEQKIEVINMGMTATNSFTVNDMARELVGYQPDLFIVYDGHNEFYGALGIASHESLGRFRWLTVTYLRLIHVRTFLLVRDMIGSIASMFQHTPRLQRGSTMMEKLARGESIPYHGPLYNQALGIFKANLEDLRSIAVEHSLPVIVSSQVSNVRDLPPFVSKSEEEQQRELPYEASFRQGMKLLSAGRVEPALAEFLAANRIDSMRAEVHFRIAQCRDTLGQKSTARSEYIKARDYDMLRFRTSTEFNNAIRSSCDGSAMIFADMEEVFGGASPDSIVGNALIVEHLHPNSRGFYLLGREYARLMRVHRFLASADEWARSDTIPDEILWSQRDVTELDERIAQRRTEILTSGWPFQDQTPTVDPIAYSDTLGQIAEKVTRAQADWQQAHRAAIEYYLSRADIRSIEKEYRTLISQIPYEMVYYRKLGKILLDSGRLEELRRLFIQSLEYEKTILAYRALGDIALRTGRPGEACTYYEGTFLFPQSSPEQVENGYLLSLAYSRAGKPDQARTRLLTVLKIKPDYQPAVQLLAQLASKK